MVSRKPTDNQKKIIDECILQLQSWKNTNDLYSPTHGRDIEDGFDNLYLDDIIDEDTSDELYEKLYSLMLTIKNS